MAEIHQDILAAYNLEYGDVQKGWRQVGAFFKARHIVDLCDRNGIKPVRVIEYGAGTGDILKLLSDWGFATDYFAVEINPKSCLAIAKLPIPGLVEVKEFDGHNTGYPDKYFDVAVLSHVLEHCEFERLVLRELKRISNYQVIEVPLDYSHNVDKQAEHFMSYGHINVYKPGLLRFLLKTEKFGIIDDMCNITEEPVRMYKTFVIDKKIPDTPDNRQAEIDKFRREKDSFEALEGLRRELNARDYTVLCTEAATGGKIMGG